MRLTNAITKAKQNHKESRQKEAQKRITRPVTTDGLINYVHDLYLKYDLGRPLPMKKTDRGKVAGLIKVLKNNGYEGADIYKAIDTCFSQWKELKQADIKTDNRKNYTLSEQPNLIDIIHCKNVILQELNKEPTKDDVQDWRKLF